MIGFAKDCPKINLTIHIFCNIQRLNFQIKPSEKAGFTLVNTPNNDINRVPLNH